MPDRSIDENAGPDIHTAVFRGFTFERIRSLTQLTVQNCLHPTRERLSSGYYFRYCSTGSAIYSARSLIEESQGNIDWELLLKEGTVVKMLRIRRAYSGKDRQNLRIGQIEIRSALIIIKFAAFHSSAGPCF